MGYIRCMIDWQEYLTYGQWIELKRFLKTEDDEEVIAMKTLSVVYNIDIEEIEDMKVSEVKRLLEPISIEYIEKEKKKFKKNKKKKGKKFNRFEIIDI